jgi:hypothetical protein
MLRWAQDVHNYLRGGDNAVVEPQTVLMQHQIGGEKASVDGLLMWDTNGYPVVSKSGEWKPLVISDGHAVFAQDADITAAAINTAYAVQYDTPAVAHGISLDPTFPTRIVFSDGGLYNLSFTAQIASTSASTVNFRFWPRVNGTNYAGSTIVASLHNNGATIVVSRATLWQFNAGDYLQVMWAVGASHGLLKAYAATSYAPAAPSTTLSISRVQP